MARERRTGLDPEWLGERGDEGRFELDGRVPERLDVWPGHFPSYFVVPGVLQLDWVIRLAAARFGIGTPLGVENLKFKTPLLPSQAFTLSLELCRGGRGIEFRIAHGESVFSTGRLELGGEPA